MYYVLETMDYNYGPIWSVHRPCGQMVSCWASKAKADAHASKLNRTKE